ncbi:(d)CMP kinase [Flavobacterium aurantiibacter]|uniref:Cytidylate kinase n=1 Tax=Flavobacterium aurantiibacter TaxID=2023067 RepID=A0A256A163_9FLAO|nr:(d)CMP kinase [Flavobacterium aurantiibacter]OYQ46844.1 cytidylate kinase [Flavobacterium aurantiibacter]
MKKKIIIAIDGHSSTGKSTMAKQLAKELGYVYVDTGAMYRAVALFAMKQGFIKSDFFDKQALINSLDQLSLSFIFNETRGFAEMYLNNENVEDQIRTLEVSAQVSVVAAVSEVRRLLVAQQQKMGEEKGIVMDGRDIGTVVFPNAELKLFVTASAEIRAKRRYDELLAKGEIVSYDEIFQNVVERDRIDSSRSDSPLVKAADAIEIDNSNLSREQQFELILKLAHERIG